MGLVRLRLVGWGKRVVNDAVQKIAETLGGGEAHSKAASHSRDRFIIGINRCARQPEIHNAINGPSFTDQINEVNGRFLAS